MSDTPREDRLASAFVELADTLVDDFDVIDFLHTLTGHVMALLDLDSAGVILADSLGRLVDAAASNEATRRLELSGISWDESPCRDCYMNGVALNDTAMDTVGSRSRWPNFSSAALNLGFTWVSAVPLRLRDQVIGALNLFHHGPDPLSPAQLRLAQALADTATIGILQQRAVVDHTVLAGQLQETLQARLAIDQAKGVMAAQHGLSIENAFELLREQARVQRRLLADLAHEVVEGIADAALLGNPSRLLIEPEPGSEPDLARPDPTRSGLARPD